MARAIAGRVGRIGRAESAARSTPEAAEAQRQLKADEAAVERTKQLLRFNQLSVVLALGVGILFYVRFIQSGWLLLAASWLVTFFIVIEIGHRRLNLDTLVPVGIALLIGNWATALVLTAVAPFTYPAGMLQIIVPVIGSGPVLERRDLLRVVAVATLLTGVVCALGLGLEDSELNDSVNEDLQDALIITGIPILTIAVGIGVWDAHQRQEQVLERALITNAQIRESRQRLVAAADDERRRLERDLHDGAQQQLVAVAMQLRLLRSTHDLAEEVDPLVIELESSLTNLRELAHGIYPPLLRSRGLGEAISAAARRSPLPVTVTVADNRYDPAIEAGLYFCCLEALQNAAKYAGPDASVSITVAQDGLNLVGTVVDDGIGFNPTTETGGVGLRNMEDRIVALGGELSIQNQEGTVVSFIIPAQPISSPVETTTNAIQT